MKIYTDGATSKNGRDDAIGGWAFVIIDENDKIIYRGKGHAKNVTNNICELMAVIQACRVVEGMPMLFTVYSDSAYIVNCYKQKWYRKWINNGWVNSKKEPVANKELWQMLIPFFRDERFNFEKVTGHSGDRYNEMVDRMAVEAKEECLM